ncbi:MAG: LysM peptidoglycan-binding domain-containing protein [Verrucomicrobiota bacterium]|nr:LysM peptidoglycan-binding domain-containing protein [Verrucomicrobiota bacterium]
MNIDRRFRPCLFFPLGLFLLTSCSPLKSSPHDEKHQLELTLHEVQTNIDDLRHDINCFQTELQILDGRIKYNENALSVLKQQDLEKQQAKLELLSAQLQSLEKRFSTSEKNRESTTQEFQQLTTHAHDTSEALTQFKNRIEELEKELIAGQRRFEELGKLKGNIETLAKSLRSSEQYKLYKVRPGDSLEKIAKLHKTGVDKIKKANGLEFDLIVVGQELKIPTE